MKVILRKDHEKLGRIGDVVEVRDGFARNYLIPLEIAYQVTPGNRRALEEEKKQAVQRQTKELRSAEKLADELGKLSVTLPMQVGEDDKLFGSVTTQMIADALSEKGCNVDKRKIEVEEPIKVLGIYTVNVKLHPNVVGKVKVWVVRQ